MNMNTDTDMDLPIKPEYTRKRQYNITSDYDNWCILNGLCPNYALYWGIECNAKYWPNGHNFIDGFPRDNSPLRIEIFTRLSKKMHLYITDMERYKQEQESTLIFCELDNIFADCHKGIEQLTGICPDEMSENQIDDVLSQYPDFFATLQPMESNYTDFWFKLRRMNTKYSKETTNQIPLKPIILTTCPDNPIHREGKIDWCRKHLGPNFRVIESLDERDAFPDHEYYIIITTKQNKPQWAIPNSVLIDSDPFMKKKWDANGGLFCYYPDECVINELNVAFDI